VEQLISCLNTFIGLDDNATEGVLAGGKDSNSEIKIAKARPSHKGQSRPLLHHRRPRDPPTLWMIFSDILAFPDHTLVRLIFKKCLLHEAFRHV